MTVASTDTSRSRRDFRVHTSGDGVSFGRLERLGIARPELGEHVLDFASRGDSDIDVLTDPAHTPGSTRSAGTTAYQRFPITVTP